MTTCQQIMADHEESLDGQRANAIDAGEPMFLIWSRKRNAWWGEHGRGYTTDRTEAGRYTEAEARVIERQSAYGPEAMRSVMVSEAACVEVVA